MTMIGIKVYNKSLKPIVLDRRKRIAIQPRKFVVVKTQEEADEIVKKHDGAILEKDYQKMIDDEVKKRKGTKADK